MLLLLRLVMETSLGLPSQLIVGLAGSLYIKVRGSSFLCLLRRIGGCLVLIVVLLGVV
jgi:hypothetical protein